jgi:hypothetical protein
MGIGSRSWVAVLGAALLAAGHGAWAQKPSHDEERARDSDICGYRLMTERERSQYRERVQAADSEQSREVIRSEHEAQMTARARERGVALSCEKGNGTKAPVKAGATSALESDFGHVAELNTE